jgi:hypothetical protein
MKKANGSPARKHTFEELDFLELEQVVGGNGGGIEPPAMVGPGPHSIEQCLYSVTKGALGGAVAGGIAGGGAFSLPGAALGALGGAGRGALFSPACWEVGLHAAESAYHAYHQDPGSAAHPNEHPQDDLAKQLGIDDIGKSPQMDPQTQEDHDLGQAMQENEISHNIDQEDHDLGQAMQENEISHNIDQEDHDLGQAMQENEISHNIDQEDHDLGQAMQENEISHNIDQEDQDLGHAMQDNMQGSFDSNEGVPMAGNDVGGGSDFDTA